MLAPRPLALLAFFGLVSSACTKASTGFSDADRTAIRGTVDSFTQAILNGDAKTAASYYTEDGQVLPPNAPIAKGRAAIEKVIGGFGKFTAAKQDVVTLDGTGDIAVGHLTYEMTVTPPGAKAPVTDRGKEIIVWRKQPDGSWRVSEGIWNSDLAPPK